MSQYISKETERVNLLTDDINKLERRLCAFIEENKWLLIGLGQTLNTNYRVIEFSEEFIVTFKEEKTGSLHLTIGYPFPIKTVIPAAIINIEAFRRIKYKVTVSIRGKELRVCEKRYLISVLKDVYGSVSYVPVSTKKQFVTIAKSELQNKRGVLFDYNNYIGDAIIGLYFAEKMTDLYSIRIELIVSKLAKHLSWYSTVCSVEEDKRIRAYMNRCQVAFMMDLLDVGGIDTEHILRTYKLSCTMFFVSRNLIVVFAENGVPIVYDYEIDDILLTNQGIFQYLDDLAMAYTLYQIPVSQSKHWVCGDTSQYIYMNLFSSHIEKDIPVELAQLIISEILKQSNYHILIGVSRNSKPNRKIVDSLASFFNEKQRVIIFEDSSLTDLYYRLEDRNIVAAITPDTSIAHFMTKIGIYNFTLYFEGFWDAMSTQSLAGESPIGYCSDNSLQLPVIVGKDSKNYPKLAGSLVRVLKRLPGNDVYLGTKFDGDVFTNAQKYCNIINTTNRDIYEDMKTLYDPMLFAKNTEFFIANQKLSENLFNISILAKLNGGKKDNDQ